MLYIAYPGVNFINILRRHFSYESAFCLSITREKDFCMKNAHVKCWWNWHLWYRLNLGKRCEMATCEAKFSFWGSFAGLAKKNQRDPNIYTPWLLIQSTYMKWLLRLCQWEEWTGIEIVRRKLKRWGIQFSIQVPLSL